jgi:invasion protein IalB
MRRINFKTTHVLSAFVLTAILLSAGCASQSETETPVSAGNTTATAGNQPTPSNVVCRYEKETGSHRKVKICKTNAQIAAEQDAAKKTLRRINSGSNSSSVGS